MTDALWQSEEIATPEFVAGNLEAKFVAPPFSVLDTRQGYWQARRRAWLSLGIQSELGRGADLLALAPAEGARDRWAGKGAVAVQGGADAGDLAGPMRARFANNGLVQGGRGEGLADAWVRDKIAATTKTRLAQERLIRGPKAKREAEGTTEEWETAAQGGTSIFDPVLCELAYRWFAPEGGTILDPFSGGSVRGIVAAKLGHQYTGLDLSAAQLAANRAQAEAILGPDEPMPRWLHGDSARLDELIPAGEQFDMVWSCPPYFDLEVYSDDPSDLSAMSWPSFMLAYDGIIAAACARLRPQRFAAFVVSEIRDPSGAYRGLVPYTIGAFQRAGMRYYNEAILVNSAGSLPLRVTKYMESSRKLGRAHQNVLIFVKGEAPRGWSYDRQAPPSPQLAMDLLGEAEAAPAPSAQPPAAEIAPEVAPMGAPAEVASPGPSYADDLLEEVAEAERELEAAEVAAAEQLLEDAALVVPLFDGAPAALEALIVEAEAAEVPELPCSREFCILPAGHSMGHDLVPPDEVELSEELGEPSNPRGLSFDALPDGRWVDTATGELFEAGPDGGRGRPVAPLRPDPPPWGAQDLSEAPPLEDWLAQRAASYDLSDPDRPCWGCGRKPIGRARDGGPEYERHSHFEEGKR